MTSRRTERGKDPLLRTLRFVAGQWRRQWRLALVMAAGLVLIAAAELAVPLFAGQMVDALADVARSRDVAVLDALGAFAAIVGLGVALVVLRYGLFKGIVRFTLRMMSEVARETLLARAALLDRLACQQLRRRHGAQGDAAACGPSTCSTTRVLVALWPSLVVLVGATALFGWHWPLMGLAVGVGSVAYVG